MGQGVKFDGANKLYEPPRGVSEDQCRSLHVFANGACIVSCWSLTEEEIAEIVRDRRVFLSVWSGGPLFPTCVGSESVIHGVVADFGPVWKVAAKGAPYVERGTGWAKVHFRQDSPPPPAPQTAFGIALPTSPDIRPEVLRFAAVMEFKLRQNEHKTHWRECAWGYLANRLDDEVGELASALQRGTASDVMLEAADVANFAMMLADKAHATVHESKS